MSEDGFQAMVGALISRGYPADKAERYAMLLGDTIEEDQEGKWVVRDEEGKELERISPIIEE